MTTPSTLSEQVLALPSGAGGVSGLGETFSADPFTGTGRFSIPITLPAGHAGLTPAIGLAYSSGSGAGICGVGWSFGVGSIRRRTNKGMPSFNDAEDVFLLGDDELVPVGNGRYLQRSEGRFARIERHQTLHGTVWTLIDQSGTRHIYGRNRSDRSGDGERVTSWHLSEVCDRHNNRVAYEWQRVDADARPYLQSISWGDGAYRVLVRYEDRPDVLSDARSGIVQRTAVRLKSIQVQVRRTSTGEWAEFDRYELGYTQSTVTGLSLLTQMRRTGTAADGSTRALPLLQMAYAQPAVGTSGRDLSDVAGVALAGPDVSLVDLDGTGLPDVLEMGAGGYMLRRNLGNGAFSRATPVTGPAARLGDPGLFLSDATGTGGADLVTPFGFYPNDDGEGFGAFRAFNRRPALSLTEATVRWVDLTGDGVGDVLAVEGSTTRFALRELGVGFSGLTTRRHAHPLPSLIDPWTRLADMTGDGLQDLVRISPGGVTIWRNRGRGSFDPPTQLAIPVPFDKSTPPKAVQLVDLTGTGAADVLVSGIGEAQLFVNGCGSALRAPVRVRGLLDGHVESADVLGTGVRGLICVSNTTGRWRFLELFQGQKPDLLASVDNGMGLNTAVSYGSSVRHRIRDRGTGNTWKYPLPYAVQVVDEIRAVDRTTGFSTQRHFAYRHGYHDPIEREFRGFAVVDQQDIAAVGDDPSSQPTLTRRFFHVGHRLLPTEDAFPLPTELPADVLPDRPGARRALRGLVYREEVYGEDGSPAARRPVTVTHSQHTVRPVVGSPAGETVAFFAAVTQTDAFHMERSYDWRHVRALTSYDVIGRVVEQRERGSGRRGTYTTPHELAQTEALERYSTTRYLTKDEPTNDDFDAPYVPPYLASLPDLVEGYGVTSGGDVLLSRERMFYDGAPYVGSGSPGSGTSVSITVGNLSSRWTLVHDDALLSAALPSGSGGPAALTARGGFTIDGTESYALTERRHYDARGMVVGARDPRGGQSTLTYDANHGLFPISAVDAAGHPTTLSRGDFPHQVASATDANGNRVSFGYDASGLPAYKAIEGKFVAAAWQGDPISDPTEAYVYDFDTIPTRVQVDRRLERLGATHQIVRYFDGFGRTLQERHQAEPDPASPSVPRWRVTGWQVLNDKGLVVRAYQPTFSGSPDYAQGSTSTASLLTTYDALGRPSRVTYPDQTYESTTYDPWVQKARDRNDNAGHIDGTHPLYGAFLDRFEDHLDTPTTTWIDALGRMVAVGEDNGVALGTPPEQAVRTTTYQLVSGAFTGTAYTLTLNQDLTENYFVMVLGAVDSGSPSLDNVAVRVTADPFGTGDLGMTTAKNEITLTRGGSANGDWQGTIIVWECEGDPDRAGFRLRDVQEVTLSGTSSTGTEQTSAVTTNTRWNNLDQVACYGGLRGGGVSTPSAGVSEGAAICVKCTPTGDDTLTVGRWVPATLPEATVTVYVVEWGSEHTIQRVTVSGTAGGNGINATSEYNTTALSSAVTRGETWGWMSGWAKTNDLGSGFPGLALALGNGVATNTTESSVAVGSEHTIERSVLVTVHSHPGFAVDWHKEADGNASNATVSVSVDAATEPETFDGVSNPRQTVSQRVGLATNTANSASSDAADVLVRGRHTGQTTLVLTRQHTGQAFAAWVQSIDTAGLTFTPHDVHLTRSVYDLKDQVLEVYDARQLGFATWSFTYDLAGNRLVTAHATAMGTRYALADAAGNAIWARDAKGVEVDLTFDDLNRPLAETSDDGSTTTLRRQWSYITYNESDPDFSTHQSHNLFGQVEEARDADGLRFFTYDWRGLVVTTSYRFWSQKDGSNRAWDDGASDLWSDGSDWDPAIPSAPRASLSDWLTLDDLTDTTTVEISMTYDAAARPTHVDYPDGMSTRMTYNTAGTLDTIEMDRGTGAGFFDVVTDLRYDARGKLAELTHGNGVITQRTYDVALERLTRIFTELPGSPDVEFQDLNYDYDPAGNPVQIEDALTTSSFKANQIIPNTRKFRYDPRNRLVRASGKKHATVTDRSTNVLVSSPDPNDYEAYDLSYAYDAVGNFQINQEYNSSRRAHLNYKAGRIDLFNGTNNEAIDERSDHGNYRYDDNGNTTHTPRQEEIGYTFDNQPNYVDLGGGGEVRYFRHGDQRVVRIVNKSGVKALGIYLGPWEYHQRQGSTAYSKVVVHIETTMKHAQVERVLAGSDPASLDTYYVHSDHLGSGHLLTNVAGALLSQEEFFPYGRASDRRDARNRYRYIGVDRDEDTGLCMTGPRTYDPVLGRFGQGDPVVQFAASSYVYASGSPVGRLDTSGYQDRPVRESDTPADDSQSTPAQDKAVEQSHALIKLIGDNQDPGVLAAEKRSGRNTLTRDVADSVPSSLTGFKGYFSWQGMSDSQDGIDSYVQELESAARAHSVQFNGGPYAGVDHEVSRASLSEVQEGATTTAQYFFVRGRDFKAGGSMAAYSSIVKPSDLKSGAKQTHIFANGKYLGTAVFIDVDHLNTNGVEPAYVLAHEQVHVWLMQSHPKWVQAKIEERKALKLPGHSPRDPVHRGAVLPLMRAWFHTWDGRQN